MLLREKDHKKSYSQKLIVIPFGGSKILIVSITIYAYPSKTSILYYITNPKKKLSNHEFEKYIPSLRSYKVYLYSERWFKKAKIYLITINMVLGHVFTRSRTFITNSCLDSNSVK